MPSIEYANTGRLRCRVLCGEEGRVMGPKEALNGEQKGVQKCVSADQRREGLWGPPFAIINILSLSLCLLDPTMLAAARPRVLILFHLWCASFVPMPSVARPRMRVVVLHPPRTISSLSVTRGKRRCREGVVKEHSA